MQASRASGWAIWPNVSVNIADAWRPDLLLARKTSGEVQKLPVRRFAGHCDMVVARGQQQISVIGGNVDHAVTMKHVPVTPQGGWLIQADLCLMRAIPGLLCYGFYTTADAGQLRG